MNRNSSSSPRLVKQQTVSALSSQAATTPPQSALDQNALARPTGGLLSPTSGSALGTARSQQQLQTDRQSLMRPQSAKSPAGKFHGASQKTGIGLKSMTSHELDQTNADGGEVSLMDTQKMLLPSVKSAELPDNLSAAKQPVVHIQDLAGNQTSTPVMPFNNNNSQNNPTAASINNFLTPVQLTLPQPAPSTTPQQASPTKKGQPTGSNTAASAADNQNNPLNFILGSISGQHHLQDTNLILYENDKELREFNQMNSKQGNSQGMRIKVRKINDNMMSNITKVIELCNKGVQHIKFEDCLINRNAAGTLAEFIKNKHKLFTLGFVNVTFEEAADFKKVLESITKSFCMKSLILNSNHYNEVSLCDAFASLIINSKSVRELDLANCQFHKRVFQKISEAVVKGKIYKLSLQGIMISHIEQVLMGLIFTRSSTIMEIDLSRTIGQADYFKFLGELGESVSFKVLHLDSIIMDLSAYMPNFGRALGNNTRLEQLSIKENKAKQPAQAEFWKNLLPNRSLLSINVEYNKISSVHVVEAIADYIGQEQVVLKDLKLNHNSIPGKGLAALGRALKTNRSLVKMYLGHNKLEEHGLEEFAAGLSENQSLLELHLNNNLITDTGINHLAKFLPINRSLQVLDISKNAFTYQGLSDFCEKLKDNAGITELYIKKHKEQDFTDHDEGLIRLASCIKENQFLRKIDLEGTKIPAVLMREHFLPAIRQNIFLQELITSNKQDLLKKELGDNMIIEKEIITTLKIENSLQIPLNLSYKNASLIVPAIKFMRCQQIEQADFTFMQLTDEELEPLSNFLVIEKPPEATIHHSSTGAAAASAEGPAKRTSKLTAMRDSMLMHQLQQTQMYMLENQSSLKHLVLARNDYITEYGFIHLAHSLCKNQVLQKLDLQQCKGLSLRVIESLLILVRDVNMTLYNIELDLHQDNFKDFKDKIMEVTNQAKLNEAILNNLKPTKETNKKGEIEVIFGDESYIAPKFDSALKVWRIMKPTIIDLTGKNLDDGNVQSLSTLISEHIPLIQHLCLRRNQFGDVGAEALSKLILQMPQMFNYLEISRNKITDKGAIMILEALKKNTRLKTLLIEFGNYIKDSKITEQIQNEIDANTDIENLVVKCLMPGLPETGRVTIQDKGPNFLRCSLKAVELLNIVYLNLSDNILKYQDAKKIAEAIRRNKSLKSLNLSNNELDHNSAKELADALQENEGLIELNLYKNQIGDKGIQHLIVPIAKQRLRINDPNYQKLSRKSKVQEVIMNIMYLQLEDNKHSNEGLKLVYALLFADKKIIVDIDKPLSNNENKIANQIAADQEAGTSTLQNPLQKTMVASQSTTLGALQSKLSLLGNNTSLKQAGSPTKTQIEKFKKQKTGGVLGRFGKGLGIPQPGAAQKDPNSPQPKKNINQLLISKMSTMLASQPGGGGTSAVTGSNATLNTQGDKDSVPPPEIQQPTQKKQKPSRNPIVPKKRKENPRLQQNNQKGNIDPDLPEQFELNIKDTPVPEEEKKIVKVCNFFKMIIFGRETEEDAKKKWWERCILYKFKQNYDNGKLFAKSFKCNENIINKVENVSQKYITIGLYVSIVFFYFTALLIPLTESDSCKNGHQTSVFFYYGIYAILSSIMELVFAIYLQKKVEDPENLHLNKFHMWKIVAGQLARADFFSDVLYMMQMYWCGYTGFLVSGTLCLFLSSFYQFYMLFALIKKDEKQLLKNIERNCKLAYVTEHQSLAIILDSFSISNYESVASKTMAIPKIISIIKSLSEDLPQFVMQVLYILFFSDPKKTNRTGVVVSILLGSISFAMSVMTAIQAKTSELNVPKVLEMIAQRKSARGGEVQTQIMLAIEDGKKKMEENYNKLQRDKKKAVEMEKNPPYVKEIKAKMDAVQEGKSRMRDGQVLLGGMAKTLNIKKGMAAKKTFVATDQLQDGDTSQTNLLSKSEVRTESAVLTLLDPKKKVV